VDRSRLPANWLEVFQKNLSKNPEARRLRTKILPLCDVPKLARFTIFYVRDASDPLCRGRKKRRSAFVKALNKRARVLERELSRAVVIDPAQHREGELERIKQQLANCAEAFNTKAMGVAADTSTLFVLNKYIETRSGLASRPQDLAALVKAGSAVLGRPLERQLVVDGDLLIRNLRNFERRRPDFCLNATGAKCVQVVECARTPDFSNL
jgi:hypothetical protein